MAQLYKTFEEYVDELNGKVKLGESGIKFNTEHAEFNNINALVSEESKKRFDGLWYEQNRPTIEKIIQFSVAYTIYCKKQTDKI